MWLEERWEDFFIAIQNATHRSQSRIWTTLPCQVIKYNPDNQTVDVQPTVTGMVKKQDPQTGVWTWQPFSMPILPMVPVKFPSGGGWTMTFPIQPGDEGTVTFSARCIDNWWQQGGVQPPLAANGAGSLRMHDLSDGFFELGGRSLPNAQKLVSPSTTSVQLRDDSGQHVISFDSSNGLTVSFPGGSMRFDLSGNLHVSGAVYAGGEVYSNYGGSAQNGLSSHTHSGVQSGTSNSGPPNPGT